MNVYLSHSVSPLDKKLLFELVRIAKPFGVEFTVALREWESLQKVPPAVFDAIGQTDCFFALLWREGGSLPHVNLEVGLARNTRPRLPVILFAHESVRATGCLEGRDSICFYPNDPNATINKIFHSFRQDFQFDAKTTARLTGVLLSFMGAVLCGETSQMQASERPWELKTQ